MTTIALIYGGRSPEHEVSLSSASGVLRELEDGSPHTVSLVGITRTGTWYLQDPEEQVDLARNGAPLTIREAADREVVVIPAGGLAVRNRGAIPVTCAFPVLHGSFGEDGTIQGLLEMASIPYVGSGVVGSAVAMDKLRTKQLWEQNGLPVVPYVAGRPSDSSLKERIIDELGLPVFIKPNAAGSSIGITRVSDAHQLDAALTRAYAVDTTVLVELALPVREIETAVLGNSAPRAFPPGEVVPTHEFYDYDAKYVDPQGAQLLTPADISRDLAATVMDLSCRAFLAVGAAGFARVDTFLHRETGALFLNEINTIPGFTPISMYPRMVQHGGVSYGELLRTLIDLAHERFREQEARNYQAR